MLAKADQIIDVLHTARQIVEQRDPRNVEWLDNVISREAGALYQDARWAVLRNTGAPSLGLFQCGLVPRRAKRDTLRLLDRTIVRLQREQRAARAVKA